MADDRTSRRKRLGVPQPAWGDNVISADFSRKRHSTASTGKKSRDMSRGATASGRTRGSSRRQTDGAADEPGHASESWAAGQIMRTATALADSGRLSRGRTYFRGSNVVHLDYELGRVTGLVSGTQLEPFDVHIRWRPLSARQISFIVGECSDEPENLRRLLAGQRPLSTIDSVLFSVEHYVDSSCTCPDPAAFCKHRVCLAYALAAEFTGNTEAFLAWRGIDMQQLVTRITPAEPGGVTGAGDSPDPQNTPIATTYSPAEFWGGPADLPAAGSLDVEFGINLGDSAARDTALRRISWNNADRLRVLDSLTRCYEALTLIDQQDGDSRFDREPWMSGPGDSSGSHE